MRVLFVVPVLHTNMHYALDSLKQHGVKFHILRSSHVHRLYKSNFPSTKIDQDKISWDEVASTLKGWDPDLVVIRKTGRLSTMVYRLCLVQRRRVIGYDQRPYLRPRHLGKVLHGALRGRPVHRITPVHGLRGTGRPDPRAFYLPFPVKAELTLSERTYAPNGRVRLLCVARLTEERKNHFLLFKALEALERRIPFDLTLVGSVNFNISNPSPSYYEAIQSYAKYGPLSDRITLCADVSFEEMPKIYHAHDICVLPSLREPLGTAPLEAMAHGCAAVISSDAGSAFYVQNAEDFSLPCGAVFESDNGKQLELELATLMADRDRLSLFGKNAAEWTRREFSSELFAIRFHQFLDTPEKNK